MLFEQLELWMDPIARPGPESMAVDEILLASRSLPLLRVYRWDGEWGSIGYFGKIAEAQAEIPGVQWVRRWTGGGIVDHRADWTYSLIVPGSSAVATMRGGESYREIHQALTDVLLAEGCNSGLSGAAQKGGGVCFKNPVEHDVVIPGGRKIAGAAQRRSKIGLLHQGSIAAIPVDDRHRSHLFASCLSENWAEVEIFPESNAVKRLVVTKYASPRWTARR